MKVAKVEGHVGEGEEVHAPLDPAEDRVLLVEGEIVARPRAEEAHYLRKRHQTVGENGRLPGAYPAEVLHVGEELFRHALGRQHVICIAALYGAARHAVVLRGGGILDDGQASRRVHLPEGRGPVASRTGEDDADRVLLLLFREGAKEEIDGQTHAPVLRGDA